MIWEIVAKPTMTKADLIDEVSRVLQIPRREAEAALAAVEIRGFGSFGTRQRPGRMGRNPQSGQAVEVPAKTIAFFKPSKEVRELINSSGPEGGLGG